jgi:hypothetical protein
MSLLTAAQLREHVETSLPHAALERILASCEQAIATCAGRLDLDEAGVASDVTERVWAQGRPPCASTGCPRSSPRSPTSTTALRPSSNRPNTGSSTATCAASRGAWGEWTTVVYTPTDDSAVRRTVLVQLCQLELNVQPGMAAQGAGPWSETYGAYLRQRNELLRAIRPADSPVPRAVPYSTAGVSCCGIAPVSPSRHPTRSATCRRRDPWLRDTTARPRGCRRHDRARRR